MFENSLRTDILNLGLIQLNKHIASHFTQHSPQTMFPFSHDVSLLLHNNEMFITAQSVFNENIHFDLAFHPLKHLGFKFVVATCSKILALNCKPLQLNVHLSISNRFSLEAVEEIYAGIKAACEVYQLDLANLQHTSSSKGLILAASATAVQKVQNLVFRNSCKPNNLVVVTGDLGGAYMGLQILEREKRVFLEHPTMQPDLEKYDYIVGRQLKPQLRLDVLNLLTDLNIIPTAMISLETGVAGELHYLSEASQLGFEIYENKLPIDPQTLDTALEFNLNPMIVAMNGGEDYELLFTVEQTDYDKIKSIPDFTVIGHVTEHKQLQIHTQAGNTFDIKAQGWSKD